MGARGRWDDHGLVSESPGLPVTLGDREYRLQAQRIGRIRHSIQSITAVFGEENATEVDDQLYDFFRVFIPDLDPKWKLMGYASAEAQEAGEYDSDADKSPTPPQIADAIEAIFQIHGGQRLMRVLKGLVDTEALKEMISIEVKRAQRDRLRKSLSSASANGESGPTSSSAPIPISTASEGSPSPGS